MFNNVFISVLLDNFSSHSFSPATGALQDSVLSLHLYSIYINSLPPLLCTVTQSHTTTHVPSLSPTSLDAYNALLAPSSVDGFEHIHFSTPINSLLFADDVAIFGSLSDVQAMLDLAADHSLTLGYRWSPTKCEVIYPKTRASLPVPLLLYGQVLSATDQFIYLGVPFANKGISSKSITTHRRSGTLATMATLNSVGACCSAFSLLLSSRLYKTFVCPKFEYGVAIFTLLKQDIKVLESIQDKCLRMIVGGHATSSTIVLKHICNLPSMKFRANALISKFCIRSRFLPAQCLLSLLHHHHIIYSSLVSLRKTHLLSNLPPTLKLRSPSSIKNHFESIREAGFAIFTAK
ncbi:hypothetical protein PHYBLDRAFT_151280 [Phycomyces blakesleeanus NRRL 1555(-)]|uniref:Reverse transcriptase domain-containing protein n=1 Tax=Phycomyces blakesleeanus (strain ATCC 8743b / DSM 1359 / FGSC 10004 / NBRC 33097 / NRRL 1555) TaxID=763407 RepID=A0A162TDL8_PHYB8|nr:hypothetical protein PHYBLDRAFT_151280 [Phycomyces blakesleeanus NRRL 1555(-)]OAD67752.1 hypothetical protein PHYBLDRAFT_151280 [Phycomyces blakesleeanus NRRL 1555(-)]|eukprot:XP_018285792.1 hypothetical protein PHYBLDRAFT_151280 [Phycomyces blakesleeanus NRRL 1555(-)]